VIKGASRGWMATALGLTLVVGVSAGVALDRFVLTTPEVHLPADRSSRGSRTDTRNDDGRHGGSLLTRLTRELDLSTDQHEQLEAVLAGNRERADAYWKTSRGEYAALREEFRTAIRGVLTDAQREQFNRLLQRDEERRQQQQQRRRQR